MSELIVFGIKQARAALFAGSFFVLLFISNHIHLFNLPRYDFLFISALLLQIIFYYTKVETLEEIKTIFLFHIIGLILEIYKTSPMIGSWSYPEFAYLKIATVPLYSGFMYSAVGSYISQAWNIFKLDLQGFKNYGISIILCTLIYLNFFTNYFIDDFRIILIPIIFIFFLNTRVYFTVTNKTRSMPLNVSFLLIAFFIWVAENISTYLGAWKYPDQTHEWRIVGMQKISSWFLMVIISFIIVSYIKHIKKDKRV